MFAAVGAVKELSYEKLNLKPLANVFLPNKIEECSQYFLPNETETSDMTSYMFCFMYFRGAVCFSA
jgi:hypothetical protein